MKILVTIKYKIYLEQILKIIKNNNNKLDVLNNKISNMIENKLFVLN